MEEIVCNFINVVVALQDEQKRIEQAGGVVLFYGAWRVNGQLAVSRAIGKSHFGITCVKSTSVSVNGNVCHPYILWFSCQKCLNMLFASPDSSFALFRGCEAQATCLWRP